LPVHMHMELLY